MKNTYYACGTAMFEKSPRKFEVGVEDAASCSVSSRSTCLVMSPEVGRDDIACKMEGPKRRDACSIAPSVTTSERTLGRIDFNRRGDRWDSVSRRPKSGPTSAVFR